MACGPSESLMGIVVHRSTHFRNDSLLGMQFEPPSLWDADSEDLDG